MVRVPFALGCCLCLGLVMPRVGRLVTPVVALLIGAAYAALLAVTGEIGRADFAMVRALASKRR
jgi:hypothetical protein